jgi:hypothetical protein
MPIHTLTRIAAVLLTALLVGATQGGGSLFRMVVFTVGFSHYFMALVFSTRPAALAVSRPSGRLATLILIVGGTALYFHAFPLLQYFGIHHAFNDVYMLDRTVQPVTAAALRRLRTAAVALHGFAYLFVLRNDPHLDWVNPTAVLLCLVVSAGVFSSLLYRARSMFSRRELVDNVSGEVLALLLAAASLVVGISFLQIVAYHFVFWFLYPLPKLLRSGRGAVYRYVGLSGAVLLVAFLCSPLGVVAYRPSGSLFANQFILWSYVHITLSFALSTANPGWILGWFRPGGGGRGSNGLTARVVARPARVQHAHVDFWGMETAADEGMAAPPPSPRST